MSVFSKLFTLTAISLLLQVSTHAQENFGIDAEIHQKAIGHFSEGVVEEFMVRIDRYNENHKTIDFFLESFTDKNERRFVKKYLENIGLTGLRPFTYSQGRVRAVYPLATIELGPIEAFENRVIIDGRHYSLDLRGGPRAQLVTIKELLEEHFKLKETQRGRVQRLFSSVGSFIVNDAEAMLPQSSISDDAASAASEAIGSQERSTRIDEVAAALLLTSNYITFNRSATNEQLRENMRRFANLVHQRRFHCRRDLEITTEMNEEYVSGRPANNPRFFDDTYPLLVKLEEVSRPTSFTAQNEMKRALSSHFWAHYPPHENPNFCRETFMRGFSANESDSLDNLCADLEDIRACYVEFRSQNRIYEERNQRYIREHVPSNAGNGRQAASRSSER